MLVQSFLLGLCLFLCRCLSHTLRLYSLSLTLSRALVFADGQRASFPVLAHWVHALELFAHHSTLQTIWAVVADPDMLLSYSLWLSLVESSTFTNPAFFKITFLHSLFTCPQQMPDLSLKAPSSWISVYMQSTNLLNLCFAHLDGLCCRCPARLFSDEHWSEFLVYFFCPCDWHFLTVQQLCQSWSLFATFQSHSFISSIKSVNELQRHSVNASGNYACMCMSDKNAFICHNDLKRHTYVK